MFENKKIKFAVLGSGHIGKRHAEMVSRHEEAELVALCDIKPKDNLGIDQYDIPFFTSIQDLFESKIDFRDGIRGSLDYLKSRI